MNSSDQCVNVIRFIPVDSSGIVNVQLYHGLTYFYFTIYYIYRKLCKTSQCVARAL